MIRSLRKGDLDGWKKYFIDPRSNIPPLDLRWADNDILSIIVSDENSTQGLVYLENNIPVSALRYLIRDSKLCISTIYTVAKFRKKKYAAQLIRHLLQNTSEKIVYAHPYTPEAESFFLRIGFTIDAALDPVERPVSIRR